MSRLLHRVSASHKIACRQSHARRIPDGDAWTSDSLLAWTDTHADVCRDHAARPFQSEPDAAPVRLIVRRSEARRTGLPAGPLRHLQAVLARLHHADRDGEHVSNWRPTAIASHAEIENAIRLTGHSTCVAVEPSPLGPASPPTSRLAGGIEVDGPQRVARSGPSGASVWASRSRDSPRPAPADVFFSGSCAGRITQGRMRRLDTCICHSVLAFPPVRKHISVVDAVAAGPIAAPYQGHQLA